MSEYEKLMNKYHGKNCEVIETPVLPAGAKELVLVAHDESTVHSNDSDAYMYVEEGRSNDIKYKNLGGGINISAFTSEEKGIVRLTDDEWAQAKLTNPDIAQDSTVKMKIGSKYSTKSTGDKLLGLEHDGWWNNELMLEQTKRMIPIFEAQHPGKQGLFLFDNSTGHNAFSPDALLAHKMNYNPSGKQPKLRDTTWNGRRQSMQFEEGDKFAFDGKEFVEGQRVTRQHDLCGEAKGTKQVCLERKLPIHNGRTTTGKVKYLKHKCDKAKKTPDELFDDEMLKAAGKAHLIADKVHHTGSRAAPCCCVYALSQCADFRAQQNALEELITKAGHRCIFLPKFHPELNFIERVWGHIKRWLRQNCLYTMDGLWNQIDKALSEEVTPVALQRKFARKSWRWMAAYRKGLSPELTAFATHKYHGHRHFGCTVDELVEKLSQQNQKVLTP